jgi:glyceraldehyde-3-phosphate dehydrogenase/erythrose-4-phosphate dehydrogenase
VFDPARHLIVSNALCTTNCPTVMAQVLDDAFGIERGFMSTTHTYTGDQSLVDSLHKDPDGRERQRSISFRQPRVRLGQPAKCCRQWLVN